MPKTDKEKKAMSNVAYASAVGSLIYVMLCTRPDICFAVGLVSRYQATQDLLISKLSREFFATYMVQVTWSFATKARTLG